MLDVLRAPWVRARIRIWTMAEFLENPTEPLHALFDEIAPHRQAGRVGLPALADLSGFGGFLQDLRNLGMQPVLMGDFPLGEKPHGPGHRIK